MSNRGIPATLPIINSSTDNAVTRWDGATGQFVQNSTVIIDDSGNISGIGSFSLSGQFLATDGTLLLPGIAFAADTNTGFSRNAGDEIAISTNGLERFRVNNTALFSLLAHYFTDGTVSAPGISFISDTNTGLFRSGADEINIVTGGIQAIKVDAGQITSLSNILRIADGSASLPGISFTSDTNTGIFRNGADEMNMVTGGTERFRITSTAVTSLLPLLLNDGTVGAPIISFASDTNTGLFRSGVDDMRLVTGGVERFTLTNTSITASVNLLHADGTLLLPGISFGSDVNTGIFRSGLDIISLVTGGVLSLTLDAAQGVTFNGTTDSTSPSTGIAIISGGAGIAKTLFVGNNVKINTAGNTLYIKEGTNACMGTATLAAGVILVNTTAVTATSRIFLTGQTTGGTAGELRISARVAGTSFTITSSSATDTRSVAWLIIQPT